MYIYTYTDRLGKSHQGGRVCIYIYMYMCMHIYIYTYTDRLRKRHQGSREHTLCNTETHTSETGHLQVFLKRALYSLKRALYSLKRALYFLKRAQSCPKRTLSVEDREHTLYNAETHTFAADYL